jgi:hypothetical protein
LNSLVHVSEHLWCGITNESPHQRLVDQIKALQIKLRHYRPKISGSNRLTKD